MATLLYVASTETFVGKSAVCMALLSRMRKDGYKIGYMKPVSVSVTHTSDSAVDEDAALIKQKLGLDAPVEKIAPVLITSRVVEEILSGQVPSFNERLMESYRAVYQGKEVVVLEGTNRWVEGALLDLTADHIINMLDAPVLLVTRYTSTLTVDNILTVQRYLSNRVIGVFINQVEPPQMDFVKERVAPFLESKNIQVLGVLPREPFLASVTVGAIQEYLGGQYIGSSEWQNKIVMSLMVGAMGVNAGLSHFRRRPNKAVFTGGDRSDIQLVALETSTNLLVLTGNIRPSVNVLNRAEEKEVPIIVVPDDTINAVERAEKLFGRVRFHEHAKFQHFTELMEENFDYKRLYSTLGIGK